MTFETNQKITYLDQLYENHRYGLISMVDDGYAWSKCRNPKPDAGSAEIDFVAGQLEKSIKESPLDFQSDLSLGELYIFRRNFLRARMTKQLLCWKRLLS